MLLQCPQLSLNAVCASPSDTDFKNLRSLIKTAHVTFLATTINGKVTIILLKLDVLHIRPEFKFKGHSDT